MPSAKLTSKGQITIPKEVREALGLHTGDRLAFRVHDDGRVEVEAENAARERGCEGDARGSENNRHARAVYTAAGFAQAVYGPTTGGSRFYSKLLYASAAQQGVERTGLRPAAERLVR